MARDADSLEIVLRTIHFRHIGVKVSSESSDLYDVIDLYKTGVGVFSKTYITIIEILILRLSILKRANSFTLAILIDTRRASFPSYSPSSQNLYDVINSIFIHCTRMIPKLNR